MTWHFLDLGEGSDQVSSPILSTGKGEDMAAMSIGKAWEEAVAFVARERSLLFPVALLFVALPGLILQEMTPPELATWTMEKGAMPDIPLQAIGPDSLYVAALVLDQHDCGGRRFGGARHRLRSEVSPLVQGQPGGGRPRDREGVVHARRGQRPGGESPLGRPVVVADYPRMKWARHKRETSLRGAQGR